MNVTDLPESLQSRIHVEPSGCWRWTGNMINRYGVARVAVGGPQVYVHRLTYKLLIDPSLDLRPGRPARVQIDHVAWLCAIGRSCCNPAHLEPVDNRTNNQRARRNRNGYTGAKISGNCIYSSLYVNGKTISLGPAQDFRSAGQMYDAACVAIGSTPANYAAGRLPTPPTPDMVAEMRAVIERRAAA